MRTSICLLYLTKMASIEKELLEKIREEVLKDSPDIREDRFDIDENWALEKMMEE